MSDAATRGFVRGTERDRGFEQVARFLLLIGAERSAPVLNGLGEREVVCIAREVAALGAIDERERRRTMEEFDYPVPGGSATTGGPAAAHRLLRAAFAEERAAALLHAAREEERSMIDRGSASAEPDGRNGTPHRWERP